MNAIQSLEQQCEGFKSLLDALSHYFPLERDLLDRNLLVALQEKPYQHWLDCYRSLQDCGIFPDIVIKTDDHVSAMWTNDLFNTILDRGILFTPPLDVVLSDHQSPLLTSDDQVEDRVVNMLQTHREVYWKRMFGLVFHELFLEPYLRKTHRILEGVDLACGWGRATFNLRNWSKKRVFAVDLSEIGLDRLAQQRDSQGLQDKIVVQKTSICQLDMPDVSKDFVLAFDIFEHLTDATLDLALQEILRISRFGAVLYCEVPLNDYFPPITHLQNFTPFNFVERLQSTQRDEKTFQIAHVNPHFPCQFSFMVLHQSIARKFRVAAGSRYLVFRNTQPVR